MDTIEPNAETDLQAVHVQPSLPTSSPSDLLQGEPVPQQSRSWTYRHSVPIRVAHWINAVSLLILIMSGLQIFNAHPALYWGNRSDSSQALLAIRPVRLETGEIKGITTVFGHPFETTGVLGYSDRTARAFPAWATIPGPRWLAMGRQWHLFFAWIFVLTGLLYLSYSFLSRHFFRHLLPTRDDWRGIGQEIKGHLLLRHAQGEAATRYNVASEACLHRCAVRSRPVDPVDGSQHVADDRRRVPLVVASVRWTARRTNSPLHCLLFLCGLHCHSRRPSHDHGILQQYAVHDYRMVRHQRSQPWQLDL